MFLRSQAVEISAFQHDNPEGPALHDVATDEEMASRAFCAELDARVFCCSACEWWAGEEEDDDGVCADCKEDDD